MRTALLLGVLALLTLSCATTQTVNSPLSGTDSDQATNTPAPTVLDPTEADESGEPAATTAPAADVTVLPDPAGYVWEPIEQNIHLPLAAVELNDGSGRFFVADQDGLLWVVFPDEREKTVVLDISGKVTRGGNEQGLLGVALDPNYPANGYFYLHYSDRNGDTVLSRFSISDNPDLADLASEVVLFTLEQPFANHNGGMIQFGPDGYLYMALGDGGSANDPLGSGQSTDTYLGKILRMDVSNGTASAPADNPLVDSDYPLIYHWGLRNPWRFSIDPATGDMYIADVGQNAYEEIDYVPASAGGGLNFGWNYMEGTHSFAGTPPDGLALVPPVLEYGHEGRHCSVTGGVVYRGATLPEWNGVYLYADYCSGWVWGLVRDAAGEWHSEVLWETGKAISSFAQGVDGEVYMLNFQGDLLKLVRR